MLLRSICLTQMCGLQAFAMNDGVNSSDKKQLQCETAGQCSYYICNLHSGYNDMGDPPESAVLYKYSWSSILRGSSKAVEQQQEEVCFPTGSFELDL